jgi:hypothetical protein
MKLTGLVVLLAGLMSVSASATTLEPIERPENSGMQVTINVNGTDYSEWAGPFLAKLNNTTFIEVFCLDFFTSIDYLPYSVNEWAPGPAYEDAAKLYSTFVGTYNSAPTVALHKLYGAALQLALWDIMIDGTGSGLGAGDFKASLGSPLPTDLSNAVTTFLTSPLGPIAPGVTVYTSANTVPMQALIGGGGSEVPEPGTLALLGAGLVAISMIRRRG